MKRRIMALALTGLLALGGAAGAEDMVVPGLGTLPFSQDVRVTDGEGTAVEGMLRQSMVRPQARGTKRTELMRFLTMPEGMTVADGTADSPAARARIYQLVKDTHRGTCTMTVVVFSGDGDELFRKDRRAEETWWAGAFDPASQPQGRVQDVITLDEFRAAARRAMEGKSGDLPDFQILDASPWKRYGNDDGTVRWQQNVKFVITTESGFVAPAWMESVLYRNAAGRYYFLIFTGSHESGRQLNDDLLYALYGLRRELL